jgi:predicted SAM-dependent methyltransferase
MTETFNKIVPSNRSGKKYMIVLRKGGKKVKTIHFGASGYEHYTSGHLNEERRKRYVDRHKNNENFNDEKTAGFYAYHILWRFKTLNEAKSWLAGHLKSKGYS